MQTIYSMQTNPYLSEAGAKKLLSNSIESFIELYNYNIYTFVKTIDFINKDAEIKASKLLKKDETVNAKMLDNTVYQDFTQNEAFAKFAEKNHFSSKLEEHVIRTVYNAMTEEEEYISYLENKLPSAKDEFKIAAFIFNKILLKNEVYLQNIEDNFTNYEDDFNFIKMLFQKAFKAAIAKENTNPILYTKDNNFDELSFFGQQLLAKTLDHGDSLNDEMKDYLKNWDADRLAVVDTILIKMALCELLYFQEIPTKVSINEYIDISKLYSTPKSKEFINGILDRMMKDLTAKGRIVKEGRGLKS